MAEEYISDDYVFAATPSGGVGPYTYLWDFDGQGTSTDPNPEWSWGIDDVGLRIVTLTITDSRGCEVTAVLEMLIIEAPDLDPLSADFTIDIDGQGSSGTSEAQALGMTLTPTVLGGSGSVTYAWTVWNENDNPVYVSTDPIPYFPPDTPNSCVGQVTLVVTDTVTLEEVTVGPYSWDWNCV